MKPWEALTRISRDARTHAGIRCVKTVPGQALAEFPSGRTTSAPFPPLRCHPGLEPGSRATGGAPARPPPARGPGQTWTPAQGRGDRLGAGLGAGYSSVFGEKSGLSTRSPAYGRSSRKNLCLYWMTRALGSVDPTSAGSR